MHKVTVIAIIAIMRLQTISYSRFIRRNSEGRHGRGGRGGDGEEHQQQPVGEEEEEEVGEEMERGEGRLPGKCEESEGKSDGGKWRTTEGSEEEPEEKDAPLTLDLTVTSPGEQPSPNPGGIFCSEDIKPL